MFIRGAVETKMRLCDTPLPKVGGGGIIKAYTMPSSKKKKTEPFKQARQAAEQFGARIGILMHLAGLRVETEEQILASLPYFSLKDIKFVHNALEARIVLQASEKAYKQFEDQLQAIAKEYKEKEEKAILNLCNDILSPALEEE